MFKFIATLLASIGITYFLTAKNARTKLDAMHETHRFRMEELRKDTFDRAWRQAYYRGFMDTTLHGLTIDKFLKQTD